MNLSSPTKAFIIIIILAISLFTIYVFVIAPMTLQASIKDKSTNVILLMSDDQGWGDVAYNGNTIIHTPSLDEMANDAIKLDRFYAAAPFALLQELAY